MACLSCSIVIAFVLAVLAGSSAGSSPKAQSLRDQFNGRCQDYLKVSAMNGGSGVFADLSRLALNSGEVNGGDLRGSMAAMAQRKDCSDFAVSSMVRMLTQFGNSSLWPAGLKDEIESALLGWQYWIDEANGFQGNMEFWTENHQMDFHTSEYLVGLLFPDKFFPGTNMTGAQHMAKGRDFVYQWMDRRYHWGFQEWKSETYLQFDVISLVHVATLSSDPDIKTRASMVLDLLLYDISIHSHKGMMASSRGRSYGDKKFDVNSQTVSTVAKILSGGLGNDGIAVGPVVALCISNLQGLYLVPEAILGIAADSPEELENIELIGIDPTMPELAEETGLGFTQPNDGIAWWGMEAYAHPRTIDLAFVMGDAWDLYNSNETIWHYFSLLKPYANSSTLRDLCAAAWPASTSILGPVNSYIYRTPDVALGAALSYRPGVIGFQQHAWQATINGSVVVFTTQPGPLGKPPALLALRSLAQTIGKIASPDMLNQWTGATMDLPGNAEENPRNMHNAARTMSSEDAQRLLLATMGAQLVDDDYADGYWTGSASMPRVGQYKDIAVTIYNPPFDGEPKEIFTPRTHAYFPKPNFDSVIDRLQDLGWVVGRAGDAYVALYSDSKNVTWQQKGQFADREILAEGSKAVWICVIGRRKIYNSFSNFSDMILQSNVTVDASTLNVDLRLPGTGTGHGRRVTFGWDTTPFVYYENGGAARVIPQDTLSRLNSPYANVPFPPREDIVVRFANTSLRINFETNTRVITDAPIEGSAAAQSSSSSSFSHSSSSSSFSHSSSSSSSSASTNTIALARHAMDVSNASSAALAIAKRILAVWNNSNEYPHFRAWGYEGGVIQLGMWELSAVSSLQPSDRLLIQRECSAVLDGYQTDSSSFGYKILHEENIPFPWGYSIGDHVALYPIAYAGRVQHCTLPGYNNASDMLLLQLAAKKYVLNYPHHLSDGTVSRPVAWLPDYLSPNAVAVWADDSFMGTAVVSQSLAFLNEQGQSLYNDYLQSQANGFSTHLLDKVTNLMHHGYNADGDKLSCCLWGRANGWLLMALTDMALALPEGSAQRGTVLQLYKQFAAAVLAVQNVNGFWHNVLNDSSVFTETSCTAYFTYAFAVGIRQQWLSAEQYSPSVQRALTALTSRIAADGSVEGIVGETGIKTNVREYNEGPASFKGSAPGLGAVLRALVAVASLGL